MRRHAPSSAQPSDAQDRQRVYVIGAAEFTAPRAAAGLHVVATPIGNLGDISLRALETLAGVDLIACEDTRITTRLLQRYGVTARLASYHEHNAARARPALLARLAEGMSVALVSDAGTPLISDPGFKFVREAVAAGHSVHAVPGPSSVMAALSVAALPTDRFFFEGFLPPKQGARRARIAELAAIGATLVLFETGARIAATLADLAEHLGAREAAICRELTKLHEEVRRGDLSALASQADALEKRGEFVVVIAPPEPGATSASAEELDRLLRAELKSRSVKDAVAHVVAASGGSRREIYARALELMKKMHEQS
jgi:16S rRNA (cytidine1402-2'-O)-methyltransferase